MKITGADYYRAAQNGISQETLRGRIGRGWDKETAITNPLYVRQGRELEDVITEQQYLRGEENGITRHRLWRRVHNQNWPVERAIREPLEDRGKHKRQSKYGEYTKIAEANEIPFKTFCARMNVMGWSIEDAATTPVGSKRPKKQNTSL